MVVALTDVVVTDDDEDDEDDDADSDLVLDCALMLEVGICIADVVLLLSKNIWCASGAFGV